MPELSSCAQNFFNELCGINVIVQPSQQTALDDDCILVIGQIAPDGTAAPGLYPYNANTAAAQFGASGTLIQSVNEILDPAGSPTADIYVYAAADPGGTAGSADVTITGVSTATVSGIVYLWVNGQVYSATFDPSVDTDADLAARLQAVIASDLNLDVTVAGNVVTIETKETGEVAGFLDVRASYSCQPQNVSSDEVTVDIVSTAGAGFPDLSGLAAETHGCAFASNPYTDTASMAAVEAYLCGQWSGGASSRAYGVKYGSSLDAQTFGTQTNDAKFSYGAIDGALTPPYLESAAYTAIMHRRLNCQASDLTASLSSEPMYNMLSPEPADLFSNADKSNLVDAGMGYFNVTRTKDVVIGRAVTTYTVADNGIRDNALRDVNKPAVYACLSRRLSDGLAAKFTGFTFRTDGVVGGGSNRVTTAEGVENCIISFAQEFSDENLIQDIDGFIESLDVQIDADSGCILVQTNPDIPCPLCCMNVLLGAG